MAVGKYLVFYFIAVFTATSALAQGAGKAVAKTIEKSVTASKLLQQNASTPALSEYILKNYFSSLEEFRHALRTNPAWALSPAADFSREQLKAMGLSLPALPAASADAAVKEKYLQELSDILYRETQALGQIVNATTIPAIRPAHFQTVAAAAAKTHEQRPLLKPFTVPNPEAFFAAGSPDLSLQVAGVGQVRITPFIPSQDRSSPLYINPVEYGFFCSHILAGPQQALDQIARNDRLTKQQRDLLFSVMKNASSLLDFNFVRKYIVEFKHIPLIETPANTEMEALYQTQGYAAEQEKRLIQKLKSVGRWTAEDYEAFISWSVYLEPQQAQLLLKAVTYLEPDAALLVLSHPLQSGIVKQIDEQITFLQNNHQQVWPNGIVLTKIPLPQNHKQMQQAWKQELTEYVSILEKRLSKLIQERDFLQRTLRRVSIQAVGIAGNKAESAAAQTAMQLEISAHLARLNRLIEQIQERLYSINKELEAMEFL